jgi:hypothetical protein
MTTSTLGVQMLPINLYLYNLYRWNPLSVIDCYFSLLWCSHIISISSPLDPDVQIKPVHPYVINSSMLLILSHFTATCMHLNTSTFPLIHDHLWCLFMVYVGSFHVLLPQQAQHAIPS